MEPARGVVDARSDRLAEGAVGVFLLGCFVFGFVYAVPLAVLVLGAAALGGPRFDVLQQLWTRIEPRLKPADAFVPAATVRSQQGLLAALCTLGFLVFFAVRPLGWLLVVAAALSAVLAATTGLHVAEQLRRFRTR